MAGLKTSVCYVALKGERKELGANQILRFCELVAAILRQYVGECVGRYATVERVKNNEQNPSCCSTD
jgi:hypothetical protein